MTRQIGLIILLVALVAILAAILFPVFAQAKNAAKSSSHSTWLSAEDSMLKSDEAPLHYASRQPGAERSVLRAATLQVQVESLEKAETKIKQSIADHGGYIDHEEGTDLAGDNPVMRLTIRVPEKSFDPELSEFEALGRRTEKSIFATDLTEQILDAEAQVKQAEQDQYPPEQLAQLRSGRDQIAGQVTMSSIDLTLEQRPTMATAAAANASWGSDAWNSAVGSAMGAFRVIGTIFIWLFVYSPLWLVPGLIALYVRRHWKRSQALA